jgi:hypothetical protein
MDAFERWWNSNPKIRLEPARDGSGREIEFKPFIQQIFKAAKENLKTCEGCARKVHKFEKGTNCLYCSRFYGDMWEE